MLDSERRAGFVLALAAALLAAGCVGVPRSGEENASTDPGNEGEARPIGTLASYVFLEDVDEDGANEIVLGVYGSHVYPAASDSEHPEEGTEDPIELNGTLTYQLRDGNGTLLANGSSEVVPSGFENRTIPGSANPTGNESSEERAYWLTFDDERFEHEAFYLLRVAFDLDGQDRPLGFTGGVNYCEHGPEDAECRS